MGIMIFVLTKLSTKIQEIWLVVCFLEIIYGEKIFFGIDGVSYIYSTIVGAVEYLEK